MALAETTSRPEFASAEVAAYDAPGHAGLAWAHPEQRLWMAAFGVAERREGPSLRSVLSGLEPLDLPDGVPGPWFGTVAFDGRAWDGFSPLRFTLPALLRWSDGERHFAAAFGPGARGRLDDARLASEKRVESVRYRAHPVAQSGERERWTALVSRALTAIAAGALEKVVVARAIDVEAEGLIDPAALLARLEKRYPACRAYLVRGDDGSAFVGATPEVLCRVDGDLVRTEALAGSSDPGGGPALLSSGKDLREHRWVVDHIVGALSGLARSVQRKPEPGLRPLANVVHLHTPISARLAPGRGVADVAAALHPTPAVLGVPSAAARRFLAEHEGLERGLYAGLVGWVGPARSELAVALRCALIRGNRARLFVGAGIVEGSSAAREWEETEMKARALLDALGVAP
ncbi:MAG: isochorismate synthase MenF [Myxococcales bacterium]